MFKKMTALFLLTAFTHVYAVTPVQQSLAIADELNRSFDELNYSLNVEWDQTDAKYLDKTLDNFEKEIAALQNAGLSNRDLIQHTLDKIKDKETRDEINEIAKVIDENQMSADEARAFTVSKLNSTYSHGTSWSGSRMGVHVALVLGVIILIVCCKKDDNKKPKRHEDHGPKDCYETSGFNSYEGSNNCYPSFN